MRSARENVSKLADQIMVDACNIYGFFGA